MRKPSPLQFGPITVDEPTVLAPMAGYTDWPFRLLAREQHCGLVVTEVVSADGVIYESSRTQHYLVAHENESPIGLQMYGGDPERLAIAARKVEELGRFDFIDINCGCPVPKIITKGAGVALMKHPEKLTELLKAVTSAVSLPITAKTRIGLSPDQVNFSEVAHAIEEGGARILAVHARFASARHDGQADWDALAKIKQERNIPIVGNGGVQKAQDAIDMVERTGVDAVMIGRAAIGNPWIFNEIKCLWEGREWIPPTLEERRDMIHRHVHDLVKMVDHDNSFRRRVKYSAEESACLHFRAHIIKYLSGFYGWRKLARQLNDLKSIESLMRVVDEVINDQLQTAKV
jgi:nifR3 family TIM-barrel protein